MAADAVSLKDCEDRNIKLHQRVNKLSERVGDKASEKDLTALSGKINYIMGGSAVIAVCIGMFICGLLYHINFRFTSMQNSLEKIEKKIEVRK